MVYFELRDLQKQEGRSRLWLLHPSELLHAKSSMENVPVDGPWEVHNVPLPFSPWKYHHQKQKERSLGERGDGRASDYFWRQQIKVGYLPSSQYASS